jgi:hypothetical protein
MAACLEGGDTGIQVRFGRIALHVREDADRNSGIANVSNNARYQIVHRKAPIGHQQRPRDAMGPARVGKLGNASGASDDACGEIPGPGDLNCHVLLSVFDAKMK